MKNAIFIPFKGAMMRGHIKEAAKIIGYFSYSGSGNVLCEGDACVIADTEEHMKLYLRKILRNGKKDIIKKTRFGEIVSGMRQGGAYAFDEGSYNRFYALAKMNGMDDLPEQKNFSEYGPTPEMSFFIIQCVR